INNTVTLTVTDNNNKTSTCPATVTVEDNIAPNALCTNVTIQLDASGNATTTAEAVGVGSNDACGILSISLNKTAYTCTDEGTNSPTLTVTDNNGNVSTCSPSITVEDNIKPIALCQDVTVQLDESGNGSTTANAVNNGSNDACGIKTLSLDNTTFSCTNVGINNTVTLTVTDNNNKTSTCSATVTVEDNVAPVVITRDLTLQLDAFGNTRAITASEINNGSNDACGIASISVSPVSFNCSNTGSNTVTLTVTDVNGKQNTGTATITVVDNRYPNAVCEDVTIQLDNNGMASVSPTDIGSNSTDNCSIATLALDIQDFGCTDFGKNTVQLTATDENGLFDICTATVTVEQSGDLPNDYSTQSIGTSDGDTFYDVCDQTFNLNATQTSPYNYKASFGEFAYTSLTGDFTFTAELESLSSNGIAGLMIRESGNPDAVMAWVGKSGYSMTGWVKMNAGDQVLRKRNGRASRIVVLKVTRTGDVITFHQGRNLLLSVQMTMNSSIQVGMYLSSKTSSQANASFKNVSYSESDIAPLNSIQLQDAIGKQSVLEQKLAAWPNPSSGEINIKSEAFVGSQAELKVYNLTGKLVYAKNLGMVYQDQYQINLQSLEAGVYIVTLESAGMLAKERIIKQ
ncbi:MAG: T9SS type A sorting domain-containing protein, partial [Bacteroidota bacterium]